jgi:hypothetical protein
MSFLKLADLRTKRHNQTSKKIIASVCNALDSVGCRPAGFVIMVWDETGATYSEYRSGGIVNDDILPAHAFGILHQMKYQNFGEPKDLA